jgi:hypothetical protein
MVTITEGGEFFLNFLESNGMGTQKDTHMTRLRRLTREAEEQHEYSKSLFTKYFKLNGRLLRLRAKVKAASKLFSEESAKSHELWQALIKEKEQDRLKARKQEAAAAWNRRRQGDNSFGNQIQHTKRALCRHSAHDCLLFGNLRNRLKHNSDFRHPHEAAPVPEETSGLNPQVSCPKASGR